MSTTDNRAERLASAQISGITPISQEEELMSFSSNVSSAIQILDARTQKKETLVDAEAADLGDLPIQNRASGKEDEEDAQQAELKQITDISTFVGMKNGTAGYLKMPSENTIDKYMASISGSTTTFIGTPFQREVTSALTTSQGVLFASVYSGTSSVGGRHQTDIHATTSSGVVVINGQTCTTIDGNIGQNGILVRVNNSWRFFAATSSNCVFGFQNGTATFFAVKTTSSGDY